MAADNTSHYIAAMKLSHALKFGGGSTLTVDATVIDTLAQWLDELDF
jgi:hypothetical protein